MKYLLLVALIGAVCANEIVWEVNSDPTSTWVAGVNERFADEPLYEMVAMLGTDMDTPLDLPEANYEHLDEFLTIPEEFDARTQWPGCIGAVRNQGRCGSCWAFGASSALEDRVCIVSEGKFHPQLSPQDEVSCDKSNMACNGGYLDRAWRYLETTGIVTEQCFPYTSGAAGRVPQCPAQCPGTGEWKKYLAKAGTSRSLNGEKDMQTAIMTHGPIEAGFIVYEDFRYYKSGVYVHRSGRQLGGHAIRLIGWGVENGVKYWQAVNSWDTTWGDNGYFKILRGSNHCRIEGWSVVGEAAKPNFF